MAKFKVGDKVIAHADAPYGITTGGWKGIVMRVEENSFSAKAIRGSDTVFEVLEYEYFDLYEEPAVKFKLGDIVIAKKGAPYGVTTNGWKGKVIGVTSDSITVEDLAGDGFTPVVNPIYFDLCEEQAKEPKPKTEHRVAKIGEYVVITKKDSHNFDIGDLCKVVGDFVAGSVIAERVKDGYFQILLPDQYDVLVNYEPEHEDNKDEHEPEHEEKKEQVSKAKVIKAKGEKYYNEHKKDIDRVDGCEVLSMKDKKFVVDIEKGVLEIPLEFCKFV